VSLVSLCVSLSSLTLSEQNITDLHISDDDYRWHLSVKCSSCGTEVKEVWAQASEEQEVSGSRGTAHVVIKCKGCKRQNTITIEDMKEKAMFDVAGTDFVTFGVFDCRGLEITGWHVGEGFSCVGSDTGTAFDDIDLSDPDGWFDYDEDAECPVSIEEVQTRAISSKRGK
jgi:CXXC motif containing zinc binding protein, eukaryotic